jgi:hypothetical protein
MWRTDAEGRFPELVGKDDVEFVEWMGSMGKHSVVNAVWFGLYFFEKSEEVLASMEELHMNFSESFNIRN